VMEEPPAPRVVSTKLPKTGSELPLIGLLGFVCLSVSLGMKVLRRA
jgi:LPXTG-motif cell wall-anchored protein